MSEREKIQEAWLAYYTSGGTSMTRMQYRELKKQARALGIELMNKGRSR